MPQNPGKHAVKLGIPVWELIREEKAAIRLKKKKKRIFFLKAQEHPKAKKEKKKSTPSNIRKIKPEKKKNVVDTPQWQPVKHFHTCQLADPEEAALCNDVTAGNCTCAKQHMVSPDCAREVSSSKPYLSSETFFSQKLTVKVYFYV